MNKTKVKVKVIIIILGTAHRAREFGKHSPDYRLLEYKYSRERVAAIKAKLEALGYRVFVDMEADDLPVKMQSGSASQERNRELNLRVNTVNDICARYGKENCIYVSVHVDASPPADGKWHMAGGWSAWTTPGKTAADTLAECLYEAAKNNLAGYASLMQQGKVAGKYSPKQRPLRIDVSDGDSDQEARYYVLSNTACPAVLTENLFQDNKSDVDFLLSDEGKHAIERLHVEGICKYIESV
ncbi:N-acetylmuramoyl-L-alanine amidase [Prevotella koreensis]